MTIITVPVTHRAFMWRKEDRTYKVLSTVTGPGLRKENCNDTEDWGFLSFWGLTGRRFTHGDCGLEKRRRGSRACVVWNNVTSFQDTIQSKVNALSLTAFALLLKQRNGCGGHTVALYPTFYQLSVPLKEYLEKKKYEG